MHREATGGCSDGKSAAHAPGNASVTTGAAAVDRYANRPAQRPDRAGHEAAPRGRDPIGGSTWIGSGFGAAGDRGSGRASQYISLFQVEQCDADGKNQQYVGVLVVAQG